MFIAPIRLASIYTLCFLFGTALLACNNSSKSGPNHDAVAITDISAWKHPVKNVFLEKKVKLIKVVMTKDKTHSTYFVTFPFDPQSAQTADYFNQLYAEVLAANDWLSYSLQTEQDHIRIDINWDKNKETMSTNIVPLVTTPKGTK